MSVETVTTCPLGHQCEEIKDGKLHRCAWYVQLQGKNPQGEDYIDEWRCAIAWQPILSVEIAQTNRGQTQAIESFRNITVRQNHEMQEMIAVAAQTPALPPNTMRIIGED